MFHDLNKCMGIWLVSEVTSKYARNQVHAWLRFIVWQRTYYRTDLAGPVPPPPQPHYMVARGHYTTNPLTWPGTLLIPASSSPHAQAYTPMELFLSHPPTPYTTDIYTIKGSHCVIILHGDANNILAARPLLTQNCACICVILQTSKRSYNKFISSSSMFSYNSWYNAE